jgi:hypothetical protein
VPLIKTKFTVKIPIRLQHIVKYSRNNKNILMVYVITCIIFCVNLHGNPAFSLLLQEDDALAHERVTEQ